MSEEDRLLNLQKKLKYMFIDIRYLKTALTHKSYAYERKTVSFDKYNERLEYLGDAILEHIISEVLFNYKPRLSEGEMTKKRAIIVCEKTLSDAMKKIDSEKYMYLGKCEMSSQGGKKDAILADAFEAVLGAIYVDGGYDIAKSICLELLDEYIEKVLNGEQIIEDYKTKLQEHLQVNGTVSIEYRLKDSTGPDHDKTFYIEVYLNNEKLGEGSGKNKKNAEQEAARNALEQN